MKFSLRIIVIACFMLMGFQVSAQSLLYDPAADVEKDMAAVLEEARQTNRHVLVQVGGNWCSWCYRLNKFIKDDSTLTRMLHEQYVVYHLNHSRENPNFAYLQKLGNPQGLGFPVIVILNAAGVVLYTQDTGLLQQGNYYSTAKLKYFLNKWSPNPVPPIN